MGFDNEALRLAYEKTVMKKQSMDWGYMNGHPAPLAREGAAHRRRRTGRRPGPRPVRAGGGTPPPPPAGEERRAREDMDRMRRLMEQMKREED